MNKETLEEAAEKYAEPYRCPATNSNEYCKHDIISAFNNGAKWQQERSYSEQEVLHILDTFGVRLDIWYNEGVDENFSLREWFNECELKKK